MAGRRLVVNASVARAAGALRARHQTAVRCRLFLEAMLAHGHEVVMTAAIEEEWSRHRSRFARGWLRSMYARRRVYRDIDVVNAALRSRLRGFADTRSLETMLKDVFLVEAALRADHAVASLDQTVRELLHAAAARVTELRSIVWVNPDRPEEDAPGWLRGGARPERRRMLGYQPEEQP